MPIPRRKNIRLPGYDYSEAGSYFITIVTKDRQPLFGALVNGAAAQACMLHAGNLVGRYGSDTQESARLMEIGQLWRGTFENTLNGLKVMQEFGFPPGFALDQWDRVRK